jgi:hypothetical protein
MKNKISSSDLLFLIVCMMWFSNMNFNHMSITTWMVVITSLIWFILLIIKLCLPNVKEN